MIQELGLGIIVLWWRYVVSFWLLKQFVMQEGYVDLVKKWEFGAFASE